MSSERKIDLKQLFHSLYVGDKEYYNRFDEQQQKEFAPLVIQRFVSGVSDPGQIVIINTFCNPYIFSLAQHKSLLALLLLAVNHHKYFKWNKCGKQPSTPRALKVIRETFKYNTQQARDVIELLSSEEIIEYSKGLGYQKEEIAQLRKEMRDASKV